MGLDNVFWMLENTSLLFKINLAENKKATPSSLGGRGPDMTFC
jgi:hypothetical protein